MYKGIYEITNKGLGSKLTNFMSFGESVISVGLFQKTIKRDIFVKGNRGIIRWYIRGKTLEDIRWHQTEAEPERLPGEAGRPHLRMATGRFRFGYPRVSGPAVLVLVVVFRPRFSGSEPRNRSGLVSDLVFHPWISSGYLK